MSSTAPTLPPHHPHQLPTPASSPPAPAGDLTAAVSTAPIPTASVHPEPELSPISKGFVGKGPRSRPNSARPYPASANEGVPPSSETPIECGSVGQPTGGPAPSNTTISHVSGNATGNNGHTLPTTSGDGGNTGNHELSGRLSGGRASGGSDSHVLTRRRSRSLSLSRDQGEDMVAPQQRQQGGGRVSPEPQVQQTSTAAEGNTPDLFGKFLPSCSCLACLCVLCVSASFIEALNSYLQVINVL